MKQLVAAARLNSGFAGAALTVLALFAVSLVQAAHPMDRPDAEMMKPVMALTRYMMTLDRAHLEEVFPAQGLIIIENFPPYIFSGEDAAMRWEAGFRAHAGADKLTGLELHFGEAQDFSRSGDLTSFTLPTTWSGMNGKRGFEEHGAWSFVLVRSRHGWQVQGYGWGVTSTKQK